MSEKLSKKALHKEAQRLGASKIACNVYEFENEIDKILESYQDYKRYYISHEIMAFSVGTYGNIARLDNIKVVDYVTKITKLFYYYY